MAQEGAGEREYTRSGGVQRRDKPRGRLVDSFGQPYVLPSRADTDEKWKRGDDLFAESSSLYKPRPKQVFGAQQPQASSSSMPFGSFTPALPGAQVDAPTGPKQRVQQPRSQSDSGLGNSLLSRMEGGPKSRSGRQEPSINGLVPRGALAARLGLIETVKAANTKRKTQSRPAQRQEERRENRTQSIKGAARAQELARAPPPPLGTLVVVENLVAGTTSDDVKAAFSDFGEILECGVQQMARSSLFKAEVLFKTEGEAETARSTLDGVLADGERLSVTVRKPTAPAQNGKRGDDGLRSSRLGAPTSRSAEQRANSLTAPAFGESKMRSDEILLNDPRAHVITEPSNDNRGRPSGQRKGRGGYRGRGDSRMNAMEVE